MFIVLRLGHRIFRDQRITTHCALVARTFGADRFIYSGQKDLNFENSVKKVVKNFGGKFKVEYVSKWKTIVNNWKSRGKIVHLTMYGMPLDRKIKEIRKKNNILCIVGGEKVPPEIYENADFNISITNQPHSEVSALAIFMNKYYKNKEFKFPKAKIKVIPQEKGKKILKLINMKRRYDIRKVKAET